MLLGGLLSVFSSDAATTNLEKYNELHGLHIEDKWERVKMIFRKE